MCYDDCVLNVHILPYSYKKRYLFTSVARDTFIFNSEQKQFTINLLRTSLIRKKMLKLLYDFPVFS